MTTKLFSQQEAFFLHRPDGFSAELQRNLLAIDRDGLGLQVWLPNALSVAL